MGVKEQYRREGKNENRQTHHQYLWSRRNRAGPTEDDPEKLLITQSAEINEFGERMMPSIFKKQIVGFSAPPVSNKHTRGPPPKGRREKFATAADRRNRQS
jgi:hypothetical protein